MLPIHEASSEKNSNLKSMLMNCAAPMVLKGQALLNFNNKIADVHDDTSLLTEYQLLFPVVRLFYTSKDYHITTITYCLLLTALSPENMSNITLEKITNSSFASHAQNIIQHYLHQDSVDFTNLSTIVTLVYQKLQKEELESIGLRLKLINKHRDSTWIWWPVVQDVHNLPTDTLKTFLLDIQKLSHDLALSESYLFNLVHVKNLTDEELVYAF